MNKPSISVIIPTYNRAKYLKRCILSVSSQTYKNIELVIIDDGSTDNTKVIIDEIKNNFNINLKYYYKDNGGVSSARNYGVKVSNGDYIAFLDSDDEWIENKLEKQINRIIKTNTKACYCGTIRRFEHKDIYIKNKFKEGVLLDDIIKYKINAETITWVIEKKLLTENDIYFEENCSFAEDLEFFLKVCSVTEVSCVKEYLSIYNIHNLSLSNNIDNHIQEIYVFDRFKKWIEGKLLDKYDYKKVITLIDQYRIPIILINYIFKLKSRKKTYDCLYDEYKSKISKFNLKLSDRKIRDYLFYKCVYNRNMFAILNFIKSRK